MLGLDLSFRHDGWLDRVPRSPRDQGKVTGLVVRPATDRRERPEEVHLKVGHGVVGDLRFSEGTELENDVSMVNGPLLAALAEGDAERMSLSGDNLQVDLDLSEENLPTGTVLEVGEALLVVSDLPHRPCEKFLARFGKRAAMRVARANRRGLRGRGLMSSVRQGGVVRVGDVVRVVERGVG